MKKLFKKIATVVAAVSMVAAMTTTAFAADDTYHVAGAEGLCGVNWDPSGNQMEKQADGTYAKEFKDIKAGDYEFKIATNGAWDNGEYNLEGDASSGGANAKVTVEKDGSTVLITFDGTKAAVKVTAPPADTPADKPADETPKTGDSTAVVAMVAVAAVAGALVVASRRQTANN
ncbi:MAG: hypothetical protein IJD58_02800 [Lachnospiraceae bacterium]|nr:hypothetical protein [Lachnospiraceae bacterium]